MKKKIPKIFLIALVIIGVIIFVAYTPKVEPVSYTPSVARWIRVSKSYTDFSTAALTNDIEIFSLPPKGVLHAAIIKHNTAFAGGSIASYTLSVGRVGSLDVWVEGSSVSAAPSSTLFYPSESFPSPLNFGSAASIRSQAISVGGNLNTATTGSVDYYLLISNLP